MNDLQRETQRVDKLSAQMADSCGWDNATRYSRMKKLARELEKKLAAEKERAETHRLEIEQLRQNLADSGQIVSVQDTELATLRAKLQTAQEALRHYETSGDPTGGVAHRALTKLTEPKEQSET